MSIRGLITGSNYPATEMPAFYRLSGEMVLVPSKKKDSYYVVTPKGCSCPAATYHPGHPCKHQRRYFGLKTAPAPVMEIQRSGFRPVAEGVQQ